VRGCAALLLSCSSASSGPSGGPSGSTAGAAATGASGTAGTSGSGTGAGGSATGTANTGAAGTPGTTGTTGTAGASGTGAGTTGTTGTAGTGAGTTSGTTGAGTGASGTSPSDGGGSGGTPATGLDGGAACPSLTGAADNAYPRWPMPNPAAANLPNPFNYTDTGNGTVVDNVTGLVWQKTVDKATQVFAWADAPAYCTGLTLPAPAGFTWHVPTRIQLLSLVDYTTGAAMDGPFLGSGQPPGGMYTWTATPWVVSQITTKPQDAWMVNFGGGGGLTSNAAAQTATEFVRCVASPAVTPLPYPHYVQIAPGEVQDVETKLIWAQKSNLTAMAPSDAATYCAGLGLNGHTWRLPSVNELSSLVDDNPNIDKVSPAIDQCVFADTPSNMYYISSSMQSTKPWALNYEDGFDDDSETTGAARCVR
jgi:hypothetical protein